MLLNVVPVEGVVIMGSRAIVGLVGRGVRMGVRRDNWLVLREAGWKGCSV